jgi:GTPase SAR1 family protein
MEDILDVVCNAVQEGRSVLVTGEVASGKTTMLSRITNYMQTKGIRVAKFDALGEEGIAVTPRAIEAMSDVHCVAVDHLPLKEVMALQANRPLVAAAEMNGFCKGEMVQKFGLIVVMERDRETGKRHICEIYAQ